MMMLMHWGNCMQTIHDVTDNSQHLCRQSSTKERLQHRSENVFDPSMMLNAAILVGKPTAVNNALQLKPDINRISEDGTTPLTLCLSMHEQGGNNSVEVVRLLLTHGADANIREQRPNSRKLPLHIACRIGCLDIIGE